MRYRSLALLVTRDRLDVSLARLGVAGSALLLGLWFVATRPFLLVIPLAVGVGSLLYLLTATGDRSYAGTARSVENTLPTLPGAVAGYLPAVVTLGLAGLVLSTHAAGERTGLVYLATGAIGTAVLAQILFVAEDRIAPGLVLAQILVAAVVIRLSALYVTPGYVGVDVWTHATVFVHGVAGDGSLAALAESKYLTAPFYHVIGAAGELVLGSTRDGIYLTLGLLVSLSALFVYATGRYLLPVRWALLATGLYGFSDQFVRWGMHVIPTSLGLVFFLATTYALTRLLYGGATWRVVGLLLTASLAVVFTHQVSTVITLVLLGAATFVAVAATAAGSLSSSGNAPRKALAVGTVLAVTLVTTLVTWSVTPFTRGDSFLEGEIATLAEILATETGFLNLAGRGSRSVVSPGATETAFTGLIPYVELVGFALLLLATVVGGLSLLNWNGPPDVSGTHVVAGATLFVVVFGLSLFGVRALLPGRWMAFLYVSMALLGAVGMYHVAGSGARPLVLVLFVAVALGYPSTMVVAEKATLDSPAFDGEFKRFAYTEAEIAAVERISATARTPDGEIATDHPYVSLFDRYGGYGYSASVLELGAGGPVEAEAAVYRDYQSTGPATFEGSVVLAGPAAVESTVCPPGWNVHYANDDVTFCTQSRTPGGSP